MKMFSHLVGLSKEDNDYCVQWLSKLSIKELRERQAICQSQQAYAFERKNERALEELQVLENQLMDAVMAKVNRKVVTH